MKFDELAENEPLLGHFDGEPVILVRQGDQVFATGAVCTHYSGPLAEGLVVDETIRCPWHHARFDLRTGEAVGAPALNPVSCFNVLRRDGMVTVDGKNTAGLSRSLQAESRPPSSSWERARPVLRARICCARKDIRGPVTLAGDEEPGPVDRPNLSKDFLAGTAEEDWIPLRTREYYESIKVDLVTDDPAVRISPADHQVSLRSGRTLSYGALLLATGAEPRSLAIEGADLPHVYRLQNSCRQQSDHRQSKGRQESCAVIGSGFIGLEVAASLRTSRARQCRS